MTLEQISKLSDDELRVKVAELCGWNFEELRNKWNLLRNDLDFFKIPNYPADLNAMHEVVHGLRPKLRDTWITKLCIVIGTQSSFDFANATARQLAEAFVLTLSKP